MALTSPLRPRAAARLQAPSRGGAANIQRREPAIANLFDLLALRSWMRRADLRIRAVSRGDEVGFGAWNVGAVVEQHFGGVGWRSETAHMSASSRPRTLHVHVGALSMRTVQRGPVFPGARGHHERRVRRSHKRHVWIGSALMSFSTMAVLPLIERQLQRRGAIAIGRRLRARRG